MNFQIAPMSTDPGIRQIVAAWSLAEFGSDFPGDTIDSYLQLYEESAQKSPEKSTQQVDSLPYVCVAFNDSQTPIGTGTLVADDELPNATEPGPWLAAVYVLPAYRGHGIGGAIVAHIEQVATDFGFTELFLYTHDQQDWYTKRGWLCHRDTRLHLSNVTVMSIELS